MHFNFIMQEYFRIFSVFFRIGLFTIGGGYAMIPLIEREVVDVKKWISHKDFVDMLAMAQSSPGVIAINTAVFTGYKLRGWKGSVVAALATALPSFVTILVIASWFVDFKNNETVGKIFMGIRPAVVALIASPVWKMAKSAKISYKNIFIPVLAAILIWGLHISPVYIVASAILGGIIYGTFIQKNRTS